MVGSVLVIDAFHFDKQNVMPRSRPNHCDPTNKSLRSGVQYRPKLANIKTAINNRRNGPNFSAEFLLDTSKIVPVVISYQVDSQTQMTKTS